MKISKKEKNEMRRDIRKIIIEELDAFTGIERKNYKMKYNLYRDLGVSDLDLSVVIARVEDKLAVNLDEEDYLDTTDMEILHIISHYNEKLLNKKCQ